MRLNKKNKILIFGFIAVLYICYSLAFSKTFKSYEEYKLNKDNSERNFIFQTEIQNLRIREKQLDSLLSENNFVEDKIFQNELLKIINSKIFSDKITLINFQEPHTFIKNNKKTLSYLFTLRGQYSGLAKLINEIEQNKSLGIILHINYYKVKSLKDNSQNLFVDIIIQKCN